MPRYVGAVRRYAGSDVQPGWLFSKRDTDRLVRAIRGRPVLVDVGNVYRAVFVVAEIGRRDVTLQWSPRTWHARSSPTPIYSCPATTSPHSSADEPTTPVERSPWSTKPPI